jgi:Arc/MetJ family transcription regulator
MDLGTWVVSLMPPVGSIWGMAREKATITLDREKAARARAIAGVGTTSEVVDLALDHLIRAERLRKDIAAYLGTPATQAEVDLALIADNGELADDTDWDALYADEAT